MLALATKRFNQILSFVATHERKIGAGLFAFGFLTDLLTFTLLPLPYINIFFASYLLLVAVCAFGANLIPKLNLRDSWWKKTLAVLFPLGVQYALGGLLSGFVVFYAAHSVIAVSWPFILLLGAVYFGNEYFRKKRDHLIFQTILFYFALYAYLIFALPFYLGTIGPWVFLGSTILTILIFAVFLFLISLINKEKTDSYLLRIGQIAGGVTFAIVGAYFVGAIPPIPLALSHAGVYQSLYRSGDSYYLEKESKEWWQILDTSVSVPRGSSLYAFSAVKAPTTFGSTVVHRWERKRESDGKWVTMSKIAFPIHGGRTEGYRGYSLKENVEAGEWRVSIETKNGQVIGRVGFSVVYGAPETLTQEVR